MSNSDLQVLRPKEVCNLLGGIHISTLYRWMDEGKFQVEKIQLGPRAVGFRKSDLMEWLENNSHPQQEKVVA